VNTPLVMNQDDKRARWREEYARKYPVGFPRRRNAEQTKKQLAAQCRYQQQEPIALTRKLQKQARTLLHGPSKPAEALVGCTHDQLCAHLDAPEGKWNLLYYTHPREYNLKDPVQQKACFNYRNMYARPTITPGTFQCPLRQAPSPEGSSRAVRSVQA